MRLLPVLCVSASVLAVSGAVRAEEPRYVRTSLDAAAEPQRPLPPRVIMATLDGTGTAVLSTVVVPRAFRHSLEDVPVPAAASAEAAPMPSSVAEFPPVDAPVVEAAPAAAVEPAQVVPPAPALGAGYKELECDCTRTGRQIRVSLDGPSEAPALRPRVIRVQL